MNSVSQCDTAASSGSCNNSKSDFIVRNITEHKVPVKSILSHRSRRASSKKKRVTIKPEDFLSTKMDTSSNNDGRSDSSDEKQNDYLSSQLNELDSNHESLVNSSEALISCCGTVTSTKRTSQKYGRKITKNNTRNDNQSNGELNKKYDPFQWKTAEVKNNVAISFNSWKEREASKEKLPVLDKGSTSKNNDTEKDNGLVSENIGKYEAIAKQNTNQLPGQLQKIHPLEWNTSNDSDIITHDDKPRDKSAIDINLGTINDNIGPLLDDLYQFEKESKDTSSDLNEPLQKIDGRYKWKASNVGEKVNETFGLVKQREDKTDEGEDISTEIETTTKKPPMGKLTSERIHRYLKDISDKTRREELIDNVTDDENSEAVKPGFGERIWNVFSNKNPGHYMLLGWWRNKEVESKPNDKQKRERGRRKYKRNKTDHGTSDINNGESSKKQITTEKAVAGELNSEMIEKFLDEISEGSLSEDNDDGNNEAIGAAKSVSTNSVTERTGFGERIWNVFTTRTPGYYLLLGWWMNKDVKSNENDECKKEPTGKRAKSNKKSDPMFLNNDDKMNQCDAGISNQDSDKRYADDDTSNQNDEHNKEPTGKRAKSNKKSDPMHLNNDDAGTSSRDSDKRDAYDGILAKESLNAMEVPDTSSDEALVKGSKTNMWRTTKIKNAIINAFGRWRGLPENIESSSAAVAERQGRNEWRSMEVQTAIADVFNWWRSASQQPTGEISNLTDHNSSEFKDLQNNSPSYINFQMKRLNEMKQQMYNITVSTVIALCVLIGTIFIWITMLYYDKPEVHPCMEVPWGLDYIFIHVFCSCIKLVFPAF